MKFSNMDGISRIEFLQNFSEFQHSISSSSNIQSLQELNHTTTTVLCGCSDFVGSWVKIGLPAKETTLSLMGDKPLTEQCSFCEQVIFFFNFFFNNHGPVERKSSRNLRSHLKFVSGFIVKRMTNVVFPVQKQSAKTHTNSRVWIVQEPSH